MQKLDKKETSSVQAELPVGLATAVKAFGIAIPAAELAGDGTDIDVPHVTLRFGVESDDSSPLRAIINRHLPFFAKLGAIKSFEPGEDGSVPLYFDVMAPGFAPLRRDIESAYPCRPNDFDHYHPHVTVAFLKPEAAAKYVGDKSLAGKEWIVTNLTFSDRNRCKTTLGR